MRRKDREVTNIIEILQIIEKAKVLHLALFDADYPYIVQLHYGYEYTEGILIFYMHCAKEGHKLDLIRSNPNVCIEVESDVELISGGDVACKYGASFASVSGRGRAELTEDVQEKIRGLSLFMKNQTGREFNINEEMASTDPKDIAIFPDGNHLASMESGKQTLRLSGGSDVGLCIR